MKRTGRMIGLEIAILGAVLVGSEGYALDLFSMGDLPIHHMTVEDREILKAAVVDVLDHATDGKTGNWENPKTGARGELTARASFEKQGRPCRELEVANSARGRNNRVVFTFCRQADGDWKIENP